MHSHPIPTVFIAAIFGAAINVGLINLLFLVGKKLGWKRFQE